MLQRAATKYGWRGIWLMLMGVVWVLFGLGVLLQANPPRSWVLYESLPPLAQAILWWFTGAVAISVGLRGPGRDDSLGHVALYLMPAIRLLSFMLSWLIYLGYLIAHFFGWQGHSIGYAQGWYAALIWSLTSLMLAIGANWPNPTPPVIPHPPAGALERGLD